MIVTATVTSGGNPVTSGTVTINDNSTGATLVSGAALNGSGQVAVSTSSLSEGDHNITAAYSGVNNDFDPSTSASLWLRENTMTSVSGAGTAANPALYCNAGGITLPGGAAPNDIGAAAPNPSNIFVTSLPGTLDKVKVELLGFFTDSDPSINDTSSLLVGPNGTGYDFYSGTGASNTILSPGNFIFSDAAGSEVPQTSYASGTYLPTSYDTTDTFTASPSGFYTLPGSFDYAQPHSNPFSFNGASEGAFTSINPNGTWSLYFDQNTHEAGAGATGWCVSLVENLPSATPAVDSASTFTQGQTNAPFTVTVTNNGPGATGDPVPNSNPMTVTDTLNAAFTYSGFSGTGWSCSASGQTVTCTNDSPVADGSSYPALTIGVNVSATAFGLIGNSVSSIGAGTASATSPIDTVAVDAPPTITSGGSTTFAVGTAGSFSVTTTGYPVPTVTETGTLPTGVTLTSTGTLSGTPAAGTGGAYPITITAANGTTNATQNFTLTVNQAPAITSANSTSFTSGSPGTFTVTTTGSPKSSLGESGPLPAGVTFTDNGNGTATISGTASAAASYPITITAQNGIAPNATQSFTFTVNPGAATHLIIPGGPEPFYTAFGFNIYAYDAAGNAATSYNGTVAFTSSDPGFVNLGPITLVNGVGTQSGVLKTAGVDTITATDVSNPSITGTGTFTIQPGVATHLGVVAPSSAYVGSPISYTVTAYDLYSNVATSYGGTVAFTSTDPGAVLPGSSAITNGVGTFSATMETVGAQIITATDAENSLSAQSNSINVTLPVLVVTTANDDAGSASNCTIQATPGTGADASCSLRDALTFAARPGLGKHHLRLDGPFPRRRPSR